MLRSNTSTLRNAFGDAIDIIFEEIFQNSAIPIISRARAEDRYRISRFQTDVRGVLKLE